MDHLQNNYIPIINFIIVSINIPDPAYIILSILRNCKKQHDGSAVKDPLPMSTYDFFLFLKIPESGLLILMYICFILVSDLLI